MGFDATLANLVEATAGHTIHIPSISHTRTVRKITTDTRELNEGEVFVALVGETFDGHAFVPQAIAQGAMAAVVQHPIAGSSLPLIQVSDTLRAYQDLGRWWRQRLQTPLVAITGSVGKTTTKELIAAALAQYGSVLKTEANFNNEIGVPKTLLQLTSNHTYGVIEMGMRGPGEIALLTQIAQPDIAVITNVGTAHIGRLGSEQAIADAKCELLADLKPGGIAILNQDNARLMATAQQVWAGQCITYGLTGGDVHGTLLDENRLQVRGQEFELPLPGGHNALNFLAALAVLEALQLDWAPLQQGLRVALPQGRARRLDLGNDIVLLDETYNAGLESMTAALQLLASLPGSRHIAVLGTMKELGDYSIPFHHLVGERVKGLGIDHLLVLADPPEAAALVAGAQPLSGITFEDHSTLTTYLKSLLQPGDRVLLKASRSVELDRVVVALQQRG